MSFGQSVIAFFISPIISLLIFIIFIHVIISWLLAFNVLNLNNNFVRQVYQGLETIMEPMLGPIRRILPPMGGLDFSPLIALLVLYWLNGYVVPMLYAALG